MSHIFKSLNNYHALRAQACEIPLEFLEKMLAKLSAIVEEYREVQASVRKTREEKQARLEAINAKLLEDGIDHQELISGLSMNPKVSSTRESRPAEYKYIDDKGYESSWSGQRRTPKEIAEAIAGGKILQDYDI